MAKRNTKWIRAGFASESLFDLNDLSSSVFYKAMDGVMSATDRILKDRIYQSVKSIKRAK